MARNSNNHQVHQILRDVQTMSTEDLELTYGIKIHDDGTVFDDCSWTTYESIQDWANALASDDEEDNYGGRTISGGRNRFDDDY